MQKNILLHAFATARGISLRRARVLLASGRVVGAFKHPRTGCWDLSRLDSFFVAPGKRGPRQGCKPAPKAAAMTERSEGIQTAKAALVVSGLG